MNFETWALFCLTETLLCAAPGPGVLLIVSLSMTRGGASGVAATLGILAATLVYFALAATGLAAVMQVSWEVFLAIKYAGAVYLIWLGVNLIRRSFAGRDAALQWRAQGSVRKSFVQGAITHGSNPKLLIFFTAILPQFIDPAASYTVQFGILGVSALVIQTVVLLVYAVLAARAGELAGSRLIVGVQRAGGALLIGAGAGLAAITRD